VTSKEKLEKFFGLAYGDLHNFFYTDKSTNTLFGKDSRTEKLTDPIDRVAELYKIKLEIVWKNVTSNPLILRN